MPHIQPPWPHALRPLAACVTLALAGAACAQDTAAPSPAPADAPLRLAQGEVQRQVFVHNGNEATVLHRQTASSTQVVKGAPYCAEAVHETVQWLADGQGGVGNRITRQQVTQLCRDGEGRTRQVIDPGGRKLVFLHDPVAGESWVLDAERKTARRSPGSGSAAFEMAGDSAAMRDWARSVADRARATAGQAPRATGGAAPGAAPPAMAPMPPLPPMPPLAPQPVVISRSSEGGQQTEIRVLRLHAGEAPEAMPADMDMPPAAVQWRAQALAPRGAGSVSPLPAKDVEGVRANGQRSTWVIEAGKVGNDKPIQITREVWTSPELMVTLASRDFDPRTGEVNYRLRNIKRGEPDPALLRVPADYSKPQRPSNKASAPLG